MFWAECVIGVHFYETARAIDFSTHVGGVGNQKPDMLAAGLFKFLRDVGPVTGLAAAVYLLAPSDEYHHASGFTPHDS